MSLLDVVSSAWNFEYALVPCLCAYLIFDSPILIRRITRRLYVPIYFAFFPMGYSDELYARYFDEDDFWVLGGPYKPEELKRARQKIITISVLSLVLTMTLSPFAAALFSHYALNPYQHAQFFWTLGIVKALLLLWALYDLRFTYRINRVVPPAFVAAIYLAYLVAILVIFDRFYEWVLATDANGGIGAIFGGVLSFLVFEIGYQIGLVAALGLILSWKLTERSGRLEDDFD